MNKKTNIRRNVIIIATLIIVITAIIIARNDVKQIGDTFLKADYKWMAIAFAVIVAYLFLEPLSLHICIRARNKTISFFDSMIISTTSFFFNAITPFSSGGQPFQVYAFHKKDVKASESTGALLVNFIIYQIVCAVICTISLIFYYGEIASKVNNIDIVIWIGYVLVVANCLIFASIGTFKQVTRIIVRFANWLKKFKIFKKINVVSLEEYCDNVRSGFKEIWAKPFNVLLVIITKTIAWLLFYSIPFFILKGVHADITIANFWYTVAVASFTAVAISFIPTPGGVGGAEVAFTVLFIIFLKSSAEATSAMLIWRVLTYYLPALLSFICYLEFERRVGKKMRIGMFTDNYSPLINGVVTSIQMLAKGLQSYGHEVFIFTYDFYDKGSEDKPEIYKNNVIILESRKIYIKSLKDFRLSTATRDKIRIIKSYNLDVIHVHTEFSAGGLAVKASKSLHIPLVHTFHTLYDDYLRYFSAFLDKHYKWALRGLLNGFMKPINKRSVITIVPTKKVLQLAPLYHIQGDVRVVPTGIDLSLFLEEKNEELTDYLKHKYHLTKDFVFIFIGRISEEKSLDKVIKCFAESCFGLDAKLLIVGNGPALESIKKLTVKLNIDKQVVFTGFIDWNKVSDYYKLGDCFVNASSSETQGLTYIEALASGLPLLVKNDECLSDVLVQEKNGIGIDTEEELKVKMQEFVLNPKKVLELSQNTKKSVENYTEMCYAKSVQKIYRQAIAIFNK